LYADHAYVRIIPAPNSFYHVFEVPEDDTSTATYIVIHGYSKPNVREIMKILALDDPALLQSGNARSLDVRGTISSVRIASR